MDERYLRKHLADMLKGRISHPDPDEALDGFPTDKRGARPPGAPYSPWMLLEHIRIVQHDFLEFSRNRDHVSPPWPEGFWPENPEPPDPEAWEGSVKALRADLQSMAAMVEDPAVDLLAPIPWGEGRTFLREVLLAVDHVAYHLGEVILLRRLMGIWQVQG